MSEPNSEATGRLRLCVPALISLAVLVFLAWKGGLRVGAMMSSLGRVDWRLFAAAMAYSAVWHMVVGADKWWRILRAQGASLRFWQIFRIRLASDPVRFVAPMKSGDVVLAAYLGRIGSLGFSRAAGSLVFDKAVNLFGMIFWLYLGLAAIPKIPSAWQILLHTVVSGALVTLLAWRGLRHLAVRAGGAVHAKIGRFMSGVLSAFEEFSWREKLAFLGYGVLFQVRPFLLCALFFCAFQPDAALRPSIEQFLAYGSVVVLMGNVPSVGGIGPREAAMMQMFHGYADPETLLLIGASMSVAIQILPAALGLPLLFPFLRELTQMARDAGAAASETSVPSGRQSRLTEVADCPESRAVLPS